MADSGIAERRLSFVKDNKGSEREMRDPNVLGWKVVGSDRETLGWVDNLVVDNKEDRARYVDVELDKDLLKEDQTEYRGRGGEGARDYKPGKDEANVLIPIGMLRVDNSEKKIVADDVDKTTMLQIPRHAPGKDIDVAHEKEVRYMFENNQGAASTNTAVKPKGDIAFKSEHHTKGNENIGTRDPSVRRDVKAEDDVEAEMKSRDRGGMMAKEGGAANSEQGSSSPMSSIPPGNPQTNTSKADAQLGKGKVTTKQPGETVGASETEGKPGAEPRKRMQDQKNEMDRAKESGSAKQELRDENFYAHDRYNEDRFYTRK